MFAIFTAYICLHYLSKSNLEKLTISKNNNGKFERTKALYSKEFCIISE